MRSDAKTVDEYIDSLDPRWSGMISKLRVTILDNLPVGFEETMSYGMIGYVVPHSKYPDGYHANPNDPLPFINLAAQKNNISLYHMGIYENGGLLEWFTRSYEEATGKKPDMGKSCIRFRREEDIPYELLGKLFRKITVEDHIRSYEEAKENWKKKGK